MNIVVSPTNNKKKKRENDNSKGKLVSKSLHDHVEITELVTEVIRFNCGCLHKPGGCIKNNFIAIDGSLSWDKMSQLIHMHREKTRILNRSDKEIFAIQLFKEHCINVGHVINPTGNYGSYTL